MSSTSVTAPRALVTGASGYLGSCLVRRLIADGWFVHAVVRPRSDMAVLDALPGDVAVHEHDGTTEGIVAIIGAARPDVVFHLASLFLVQHQTADVVALVTSNVLFSTQLVEAMAAHGVRHLVNAGTSWQHHRDSDYLPVNLYAATKQAFEDILAYYCDAHEIKAATLVLFDTHGPDDPRRKLMALLREAARTGEPLSLSPGEQLLDMVHVDDVVEAFVLAARQLDAQEGGHRHFGVSSGAPMPLRELVDRFQRATGLRVNVAWGARPYRPREVMVPWTRFDVLAGWTPRVSFEEGVAQASPLEGMRQS